MSKLSVLSIKKLSSSLFCLGITLILLLALWIGGFFSYFDTTVYDFLLRVKINSNPQALNPQIIPIDLNDKSEMTLGERLDDRSAFGDLFSVLQYCSAQVALDFIYRGEREQDTAMLEAAAAMKTIIIAVIPVPEGRENVSYRELTSQQAELLRRHLWRPKVFGAGKVPRAGTFIMPFSELGERATQLAHISVDPDADGIFRRTPLFYAWDDGLIPAISLAAALRELGVDGNDIEVHYGKEVRIPIGPDENISIPIDSSGMVVVPFRGKWVDTTHRHSFDKLANAWFDKNELNEIRSDILRSLCFVADTTFEKKDLGPVPAEKVYPLSGLHTWVISSILDASLGEDTFFHEASYLYRNICIILFAVLFLFIGLIDKDTIFNASAAFFFLGFTGLTLYFWFSRRIIPWYTLGALEILFTWLFGFIYRFLTQRRRQSTLERYVPRSVAQKVVSGQRISLVPMKKNLTIMFTDIKEFTTWSSDKESQEVHDFLNEYLESMADILFAHGGTVDKFMGDGILAFFGDPVELPNHAEQAIKSAMAMQRKIAALREEWKPRVGIDLKVRMGINTGKVIVGDLGTKRRIEYTVIGSAVNMAQRMEGSATPGGILVTEYTRDSLENSPLSTDSPFSRGDFTFSKKKEVMVKGYDKPVAAYEIIF